MARRKGPDKRGRILEAALKVFAAKGFFRTKVSEVAQEAGVADGTIYNYFKSKDEILISLFEDRMDWILSRLDEVRSGDVEVQLTRYIDAHLSLAMTDPELAAFLTVELRQSDRFLREYKNEKFQSFLRVLAQLIERGQEEGRFRKGLDPKLASRAIFGALDELLLTLTWTPEPKHIDYSEMVHQVADLFLCGLKANRSPG